MNIECSICMGLTHKTEDRAVWHEAFHQAVEDAEKGIRRSKERIALEKERISRLEEDKVLWLAKIEDLKKGS